MVACVGGGVEVEVLMVGEVSRIKMVGHAEIARDEVLVMRQRVGLREKSVLKSTFSFPHKSHDQMVRAQPPRIYKPSLWPLFYPQAHFMSL